MVSFVEGKSVVETTFLTFKMASFSVKPEKDSKCQSLNSPLFMKKFSRSQKLRADALGWDGWKKEPFEFNQSLISNLQLTSLGEREKMEPATASGCNLLQFDNERISKHPSNQLPINTFETSFLSDNLLASTPNVSAVPSELNSSYVNTSRAIFTIHLPSSQILVVNSAACQLMNYSSDELCSMKLENLVIDSQKQKVSNLYEKFLKSLGEIPHSSGKLLEFVRKDGEIILVSIYLKKLDNPERCLAILEPIDRKTGLIYVDENGKITSCDENIALIFQYDPSECIGLNIYSLLPAVNLLQRNEGQFKKSRKQQITGRTKTGEAFPVSLAISCGSPHLEDFKIVIWMYTSLSGLIFLNRRLLITDFNSYFIKLLFGFSKRDIINKPIASLIPTFCKDIGFECGQKDHYESSSVNDTSIWCKKNESLHDCSDNSLMDGCLNSLNSSISFSLNSTTNSSKQNEWSSSSSKVYSEKEEDLNSLFAHMNIDTISKEKNNSDYSKVFQNGFVCDGQSTPIFQTSKRLGKNESEQKEKSFEYCHTNYENIMVQEGKFLGLGLHCDGTYIDIQYHVNNASNSEGSFYCVWLSRDMFRFSELSTGSNANMVTYFNSTSVDGSLQKDSICSGQYTRPSTASLISQCDENLTAGDYSQYYTNIRQIGKGAFGYVKMAFRNLDGLLVVTKFIKKQSINIRSWVFHSNLNMKIPLEISLLTTLHHPNIVKVLDVFHNDSFVQLVMEKHGAGFDLFEFINRGPKCDEKLKSYIFRQIISAVHYLDSLGILHRDIKDENVIINEKFEIKLIDFGSATFMPPNETFSKFYGTVEYCSPEVLQGNSYKGPELEIWALGVTLYVLTFGENPFSNIEGTIKGEFSIPFPISVELDDLLHQMLDKNVETRITIGKVALHYWINQPVSIENYRFEDVVKCSDEEAYPPKYVHEIKSEDLYAKDSRTDSNHLEDTNNSNGSLQNLAEIDDLDDNFQTKQKYSFSDIFGNKANASPVMLSARLAQWNSDRLCKSATSVPNRFENSPSVSDSGYECIGITHIKPEHVGQSSSENESDDAKDVPEFCDLQCPELKMPFKTCFLEEEYLSTNNSNQSEIEIIQSVHETYEFINENGCTEFLGAEGDTDNECFNPN